MKILILGAAGQIGKLLTENLLTQTSHHLVLYARNANTRLSVTNPERITVFNGDFEDAGALYKAMEGVDLVYVNDLGNDNATRTIIGAMNSAGVNRIIGASTIGVYNEVPGAFGEWNNKMIGHLPRMQTQKNSAQAIEESGLEYTLLRLTWLYNQKGNKDYTLTPKGESFKSTQITREAVAQVIMDIINADDERFINKSLGVGEPQTEWDKPSFY